MKKCQVSPFSVLLCPSLPLPTPFSHISYLSCSQYPFLHPRNNAFVLLHLLLSIPPSLYILPSVCLVLSVTSLPCQAMRERGRDRPCHCPRINPRNISSVFLEQERRALASNLSDLMMSGNLFSGPFICFPSSFTHYLNRLLGPQHERQCRIVCAAWLTGVLHQISSTSTSCVWRCQQGCQIKWQNRLFLNSLSECFLVSQCLQLCYKLL